MKKLKKLNRKQEADNQVSYYRYQMSKCKNQMRELQFRVNKILESDFSSKIENFNYKINKNDNNILRNQNYSCEKHQISVESETYYEEEESENFHSDDQNMTPITDINIDTDSDSILFLKDSSHKGFESKDSLFVATGSMENLINPSLIVPEEIEPKEYNIPKCFSTDDDEISPIKYTVPKYFDSNDNFTPEGIDDDSDTIINTFTKFSSDFEEEEINESTKSSERILIFQQE